MICIVYKLYSRPVEAQRAGLLHFSGRLPRGVLHFGSLDEDKCRCRFLRNELFNLEKNEILKNVTP